ncbi:MAG: YncE family protein [Rhodospirillales bacterium]|nr:YncE family protein [Acetobacter sp.]
MLAGYLGLGTLTAFGADRLLVLSKGDHTLAVVNPATNKVMGKAPVGVDPHEVVASTDGKLAYVSIYGGGSLNTIDVIDIVHNKALAPIDLGPMRGPHGLVFVGGKLWFTAEGAKAIGHLDPASGKVDWILGTGQDRTHMLWVAPDQKTIYTTNVNSATVSILERSEPVAVRGHRPPSPPGGTWKETVVPVGHGDEGFDVSPDGKELWTANAADGTISILDLGSKKVSETLSANVKGANRLRFTPDGKLVLVSSLDNNTGLAILDAKSHKELKRLPTPKGAAGIEMQPDGTRAFVSCTGSDYVAVVDLKSLTISNRLLAGRGPDGLAWTTSADTP